MENERLGVFYTVLAYVLWGILPIYWKWLVEVPSDEILANRVFWSFIFMIILLTLTHKVKDLKNTVQMFKNERKQAFALIGASFLITGNWFIYIWAVNSEHVVDASLGYYINPLVSVLLGIIFLKERLTITEITSFILAAIGVCVLTFSYGTFPWVAFALALSFGIYGLLKKLINVDSAIGLTLETFSVTPLALGYMIYLFFKGQSSFLMGSITTDLLLIGAGAMTALPLLYFAKGAKVIPMFMIGILQYIAPTMMLIIGVLLYDEPFTTAHLISFLFIWSALFLFTFSKIRTHINGHKKEKQMTA